MSTAPRQQPHAIASAVASNFDCSPFILRVATTGVPAAQFLLLADDIILMIAYLSENACSVGRPSGNLHHLGPRQH
jgi:hypothetical protein